MRFVPPPQTPRCRRQGVALVIVLSFIVLLSGLILAFFSRAISERLISNSSANQVKVDLFTQGAADTIIGDLKQEIAAGSTFATPAPNVTIYVPKPATATAASTILPAVVLGTATNNGGLNNLVKRSARIAPFYKGASYDTANYPPPGDQTVAVGTRSRAGAVGSNAPSLNGRFISPERWNKGLLLAKKDLTTDAVTPTTDFVAPDWVLVARDGSNPLAWDPKLATSPTASTSVVGRYAYNIYDEGGLLDANVAGYPTASSAYPSTTSGTGTSLPPLPTRKSSLAYADLTVPVTLPDGTTSPLLTGDQVNTLVGWRNYASAKPSGSFPSYVPAPTPGLPAALSPFDIATLGASNGYLSVAKVPLYPSGGNGQSDRVFAGRQELLKLLLQGVATDSPSRIKLQNSLQYLGTFSRGLEQPSFIKTQSVDPAALGYDSTAPHVLDQNTGGTTANGLDSVINPSFLTVRIKTAATSGRADGSGFVVGEPLVKKRFPLNRLAWLTYAGPITLNGTSYNPQLDPAYIPALKQTYGFTDSFLLRGNATNVQLCFGLTWDGSKWNYNTHNRGGSTGPICKLSAPADAKDVVRDTPAREPDFFELLKATVNVGSLGKAATAPSVMSLPGGSSGSYQSQYTDDASVDDAIIQIGANIIDQFDVDGYPTHIHYNDGGSVAGKEIYGMENLPYISRITHALIKVKQAEPSPNGTPVKNSGVGALLQCPELWNPHDYQTNNLAQTAGVVGPTKFRVYATSGNAGGVNAGIRLYGFFRSGSSNGHNHPQANVPNSPGYESMYNFSYKNLETRTLTQANTELDFEVGRDSGGMARFREPTILYQLVGTGGYVTASPSPSGFGIIASDTGFFVPGINAFKSDVSSGIQGVPPSGSGFVGFYLGAVPLYWSDGVFGTNPPNVYMDNIGLGALVDVQYRLQYQDANGNWVTYDEKDRTLGGSGTYSENNTLCGGGDKSPAGYGWNSVFYPRATTAAAVDGQWDSCYAVMDPRTPRFHMMKFTADNARYWTYPPYSALYPPANDPPNIATRTATASTAGFTYGWIDSTKGITLPLRSGTNDGSSLYVPEGLFPSAMGWNPGSAVAGAPQSFATYNSLVLGTVGGLHICRPGMFSQNNPFARRNDRALGDIGDTMDGPFTATGGPSNAAQCYSDPDGVIRRATGGLVPYASNLPATTDVGLPMTPANTSGVTRLSQSDSRPVILNRPFRSVGELAYTFSGTPWKNLNFTMPESGDSALLDVFCISDTDDPNGLVAGKVNLNTRQAPVLQAIVAGAYKDEWNPGTATVNATLPATVAKGLVTRTTTVAVGKGALQNVSELVGRFVTRMDANTDTTMSGIAGATKGTTLSPRSYDGFSADLINNTVTPATGILVTDPNITIPRFANATVRALAASGQTRVWNLMIDVVAQTGRYPQNAGAADRFLVEGEQRYWVHVALDRFTGQVLDKQIEVVKE